MSPPCGSILATVSLDPLIPTEPRSAPASGRLTVDL